MLFKVLDREEFGLLVEHMFQETEIVAPKKTGVDVDDRPVYQYLPIQSFDEIALDHDTTDYSSKTYFLPYQEKLSTFSFEEDDWEQEIRYRIQPRAIIGLHPCDVNALVKLDKVFARDFFPNPYYLSR